MTPSEYIKSMCGTCGKLGARNQRKCRVCKRSVCDACCWMWLDIDTGKFLSHPCDWCRHVERYGPEDPKVKLTPAQTKALKITCFAEIREHSKTWGTRQRTWCAVYGTSRRRAPNVRTVEVLIDKKLLRRVRLNDSTHKLVRTTLGDRVLSWLEKCHLRPE